MDEEQRLMIHKQISAAIRALLEAQEQILTIDLGPHHMIHVMFTLGEIKERISELGVVPQSANPKTDPSPS